MAGYVIDGQKQRTTNTERFPDDQVAGVSWTVPIKAEPPYLIQWDQADMLKLNDEGLSGDLLQKNRLAFAENPEEAGEDDCKYWCSSTSWK